MKGTYKSKDTWETINQLQLWDPEPKSKSPNPTVVQSLLSDRDFEDTCSEWQINHPIGLRPDPTGWWQASESIASGPENTYSMEHEHDWLMSWWGLGEQCYCQRRWGFYWLEGVTTYEQLCYVVIVSLCWCFLASGPSLFPNRWSAKVSLMLTTLPACAIPLTSPWHW